MVNVNKIFIFTLFVFVLTSNTSYAINNNKTPQLYLLTNKVESTLGRPIRIEVYGISLKSKISNLKLTQLKKDFGVETDHIINNTSDKRWPNKSIQILKLKLYPRRSGDLVIPSLTLKKAKSDEKTIHVIDKGTIQPAITTSLSTPYERQQIPMLFTLKSSDSSSRLSIKNEAAVSGFDSTPLKFKRIKNNDGTYLLQIGWGLTAIKSGVVKLELPPIEYSISGVLRKKFYLPIKMVTIKALPLYIPPTTPIGKIEISSTTESRNILNTDSLSYWNLNVTGTVNNAYELPPVLRRIKSNAQFKFLPINSKRYTITTADSSLSTVEHSIPFKSLKSGFLTLPDINIQYFDPDDGKLKTISHHATTVFVLSNLWRVVITTAIFLLLIYYSRIVYKISQHYSFTKRKRGEAINKLQNNGNLEIREAIILIAESEFWPKNTTLKQWAELWKTRYRVNNSFAELITRLSVYLYSENKDNNELHLQLLKLINNRKRL